MLRARLATPLTLTCLIALTAEASAFGVDWPAPEPRFEPSEASERASKRPVRPTVTPRSVGERTAFVVRFKSHARLGLHDGRRRGYELLLRSRRNTGACLVNPSTFADRGRRGQTVAARFDPRKFKGGRWCRGPANGRIYYYDVYGCPALGRCETPDGFRGLRRLVGRFAVHVR